MRAWACGPVAMITTVFFSSRRRHTRCSRDWSSDVCSSDLYRQFAVTIAASTVISCFVSLTLSPALCAVLFKDHDRQGASSHGLVGRLLHVGFGWFNRGFERLSNGYGNLTRRLVAGVAIVLVIYVALVGVAGLEFRRAQTGFIPEQDQGYLITVVQLPPGATLARTEE